MSFKSGALIAVITAILVVQLPKLLKPSLPTSVGGFAEPGFESVAAIFRKNVENGVEPGGSFSAYYRGKLVVNLWGGYADEELKSPWKQNTINQLFSTTKAIGAIMIAMLVDRGLLDYDQPVSKYWPDFAQNGKENVKVRELVSHQAGLPALDVPILATALIEDPDKMAAVLAQQKPAWKLGTGLGYHALTFGLYVDQLIRRADPKQRTAQQFFADEIAKPFDVDLFVGKPLSEHYRAARINHKLNNLFRTSKEVGLKAGFDALKFGLTLPALTLKTFNSPQGFPVDAMTPELESLGVISTNGFGTTEALAKIFGILSSGGKYNNRTLLSEKAIARLTKKEVTGKDKVLTFIKDDFTFGLGVMVLHPVLGSDNEVFGHYGYGCQAGFADVANNVGWGYTTNYISGIWDPRQERRYSELVEEVYKSIQQIESSQM